MRQASTTATIAVGNRSVDITVTAPDFDDIPALIRRVPDSVLLATNPIDILESARLIDFHRANCEVIAATTDLPRELIAQLPAHASLELADAGWHVIEAEQRKRAANATGLEQQLVGTPAQNRAEAIVEHVFEDFEL